MILLESLLFLLKMEYAKNLMKYDISKLSSTFNKSHFGAFGLFVYHNNIRLKAKEAQELAESLPDESFVWMYKHVIFSVVEHNDRKNLKEYFGVQGYYHSSNKLSDQEFINRGKAHGGLLTSECF